MGCMVAYTVPVKKKDYQIHFLSGHFVSMFMRFCAYIRPVYQIWCVCVCAHIYSNKLLHVMCFSSTPRLNTDCTHAQNKTLHHTQCDGNTYIEFKVFHHTKNNRLGIPLGSHKHEIGAHVSVHLLENVPSER